MRGLEANFFLNFDLQEHLGLQVLQVTVVLLGSLVPLDLQVNLVMQEQLAILVKLLLQDCQVIRAPVDPWGSLDHRDLLVHRDLVELQETMVNRVILDFLDLKASQVLRGVLVFLEVRVLLDLLALVERLGLQEAKDRLVPQVLLDLEEIPVMIIFLKGNSKTLIRMQKHGWLLYYSKVVIESLK